MQFQFSRPLLPIVLSFFIAVGGAYAQEAGKGASMRPEIGKPVQAAVEALKAKRGKEALAKLSEAEAIGGKTAYESFVIDQIKGQAAALAGDASVAAAAFESASNSSAVSGAQKLTFMAAAIGQYYTARAYGKSAELASRYFKEGGNDKALRTIYVQSLYLGGDMARALKELQADIQAADQPTEQQLQMLSDIANRQKDSNAYIAALEKLVVHYPKREYWQSLVFSVATKPGFSDRLALDMLRIKLATGTIRTAAEYVEAVQLALQAGYPAEAKKFLEAGYGANQLGTGAEAERHTRLKGSTEKALAEDTKTLGADDAKVAALPSGDPQMNAGFNYVLRGQHDKGLPMLDAGFKKGNFKRPEDARLHYGIALLMAGQKTKGIEMLRGVKGADGTAEIARLWILQAQRS